MMKSFSQTFLIFCMGFYISVHAEHTPTVINLSNGNTLKGVLLKSVHTEKAYVEFRGLRYAKPPIGKLRFKPSHLFDDIWEPLDGDATTCKSICPQLDPWYDPNEIEDASWEELKVLGDEDCLFANVATSDINPVEPLPVLVWIHGGNFQSESGQDYGVAKFMEHNIVVVNFNYRLGVLGFLNSEDGIYNGNQGLKDQKLLLEWVKRCIHLFGGDPNKITLAGSNAGGVSVHLHLLSNFSRGLFHKAIIQSATAISPWVLVKEPRERMLKLAKHLQCGNDTDVETCIAQKDAVTIVQKSPKLTEWFLDPMVPFGPSIEMHGDTQDRFLDKDPYTLLSDGSYWSRGVVPVIMGVNSHEGLLHAMDIGHQGMLRMVFNMEWYGAAPISLYFKKTAIDPRTISEAVRNFYFPLTDEDKANGSAKLVDKNFQFDNLTSLYSDRHFFVPLHHSAKLMGLSNELYLYWFDYVSDQTIHQLYGYNSSHIFGPSHYDQLQYLFVTPYFNKTTQEDHVKFEKQVVEGFYTFINEGSPFFDSWEKVSSRMAEGLDSFIYNRIGKSTQPIQIPELFTNRVEFWSGLFLMEYGKASFVNELIKEQESGTEPKIEL